MFQFFRCPFAECAFQYLPAGIFRLQFESGQLPYSVNFLVACKDSQSHRQTSLRHPTAYISPSAPP